MRELIQTDKEFEYPYRKWKGLYVPVLRPKFKETNIECTFQRYRLLQGLTSLRLMNAVHTVLAFIIALAGSKSGEPGMTKSRTLEMISIGLGCFTAVLTLNLSVPLVQRFLLQRPPMIFILSLATWAGVWSKGIVDVALKDAGEIYLALTMASTFVAVFTVQMLLPLSFELTTALSLFTYLSNYGIIGWKVFNRNEKNIQPPYFIFLADLGVLTILMLSTVYIKFLTDLVSRQGFVDTLNYMSQVEKSNRLDEKQSKLLLSVMPDFIVNDVFGFISKTQEEAQSDIREETRRFTANTFLYQFEEVSILFADIKGFTELASSCDTKQLVIILNDLFDTFDQLAEENNCLRIKLLGDCYYCVSGLDTQWRPDHAVSCVQLGLLMINAVDEISLKYKVNLSMRVGVHTGSILCGIIGRQKWQFDIWSHDVNIANHMESGGIPGLVHVTTDTVKCLGNVYRVQEGSGGSRDPFLERNNITTFLIKGDRTDCESGSFSESRLSMKRKSESILWKDESSRFEETKIRKESTDFEVQSIKDGVELLTGFLPHFKDQETEQEYKTVGDNGSTSGIFNACLTLILVSISCCIVHPIFCIGNTIMTLGILSLVAILVKIFLTSNDSGQACCTTWYNCLPIFFSLTAILIASLEIGSVNVSLMSSLISTRMFSTILKISEEGGLRLVIVAILSWTVASAAVVHKSVFPNMFLNVFIVLLGTWIVIFNDLGSNQTKVIVITLIAELIVIMIMYWRWIEIANRLRFLRTRQCLREMKEVRELQCANSLIIRNILPDHVANYFLHQHQTSENKELYSESWESVGVIFATIPKLKEAGFVKGGEKQTGADILILNDVINQFDELLEDINFCRIEKIKNIGGTYMACSGLRNPKDSNDVDDEQDHFCDLIDFALEMKLKLDQYNLSRFTDFELRVGASLGPVVSGVIGATKPSLDIWGNTVNEASRMETTGEVNSIQATKKAAEFLEARGYFVESRGTIEVKGKGLMETFSIFGRTLPSPQTERILGQRRETNRSQVSFATAVTELAMGYRRRQKLWKNATITATVAHRIKNRLQDSSL